MGDPPRFVALQKPSTSSSKTSKCDKTQISHKKTNVTTADLIERQKDQVIKSETEPDKSSKLIRNRPQPKKIPMNKKGVQIAKGKVANKADYPTMENILSDWGTDTEEAQNEKKDHSKADKKSMNVTTKLNTSSGHSISKANSVSNKK